jgi:hypothetical protein
MSSSSVDIVLNGDELNTNYFKDKLTKKFPNVHGVSNLVKEKLLKAFFSNFASEEYQLKSNFSTTTQSEFLRNEEASTNVVNPPPLPTTPLMPVFVNPPPLPTTPPMPVFVNPPPVATIPPMVTPPVVVAPPKAATPPIVKTQPKIKINSVPPPPPPPPIKKK